MSGAARPVVAALSLSMGLAVATTGEAQSLSGRPRARPPRSATAELMPPGPASITQSSTTNITAGNSVNCNNGTAHFENSYYRAFTLADYPQLDSVQFRVDRVQIGVEEADDGGGTGQPLTLRLHSSTTNPPTLGSLTLLSTTDFTIPDQAGTPLLLDPLVPPVLINASDILVVEIFTPDGIAGGHSFLIGSNPDPETHPSYIRAPTCGLPEITALASTGFPLMHIVMIVSGNNQVPVQLQSFQVH